MKEIDAIDGVYGQKDSMDRIQEINVYYSSETGGVNVDYIVSDESEISSADARVDSSSENVALENMLEEVHKDNDGDGVPDYLQASEGRLDIRLTDLDGNGVADIDEINQIIMVMQPSIFMMLCAILPDIQTNPMPEHLTQEQIREIATAQASLMISARNINNDSSIINKRETIKQMLNQFKEDCKTGKFKELTKEIINKYEKSDLAKTQDAKEKSIANQNSVGSNRMNDILKEKLPVVIYRPPFKS